jgi:hypothetical protein
MKLKSSISLTTVLLALAVAGLTLHAGPEGKAPAINPTGTWKWIAPLNPDGRPPETTFTLKLQGATLTGTVNKNTSTAAITNGVVKGDTISFQTVREGKAGKTTITYSGKLSGDTIKGTVEIAVGNRKMPSDWEAKRVKQ